jgi:hypothetical protein
LGIEREERAHNAEFLASSMWRAPENTDIMKPYLEYEMIKNNVHGNR